MHKFQISSRNLHGQPFQRSANLQVVETTTHNRWMARSPSPSQSRERMGQIETMLFSTEQEDWQYSTSDTTTTLSRHAKQFCIFWFHFGNRNTQPKWYHPSILPIAALLWTFRRCSKTARRFLRWNRSLLMSSGCACFRSCASIKELFLFVEPSFVQRRLRKAFHDLSPQTMYSIVPFKALVDTHQMAQAREKYPVNISGPRRG